MSSSSRRRHLENITTATGLTQTVHTRTHLFLATAQLFIINRPLARRRAMISDIKKRLASQSSHYIAPTVQNILLTDYTYGVRFRFHCVALYIILLFKRTKKNLVRCIILYFVFDVSRRVANILFQCRRRHIILPQYIIPARRKNNRILKI